MCVCVCLPVHANIYNHWLQVDVTWWENVLQWTLEMIRFWLHLTLSFDILRAVFVFWVQKILRVAINSRQQNLDAWSWYQLAEYVFRCDVRFDYFGSIFVSGEPMFIVLAEIYSQRNFTPANAYLFFVNSWKFLSCEPANCGDRRRCFGANTVLRVVF